MFRLTPARLGIIVGALLSIVFGLVYFVVLREPGSAFYPFAGLAFLGGPLLGGFFAAWKTERRPFKAFMNSAGAVFGIVFALFLFAYMILPQFDRRNVQLPSSCDGFDGSFNPPAHLAYTLPGGRSGILIASDAESAVVATIDQTQPSFPGAVFLVNKSDNKVIRGMGFGNDVISAAIDEGVVYIFNDKLGYLLNARTGEFEESFLIIDNYGGLTESDRPIISRASDGHWYMETAAVISSWSVDGTVKSRPDLIFSGIARGCFISGETDEVTQL